MKLRNVIFQEKLSIQHVQRRLFSRRQTTGSRASSQLEAADWIWLPTEGKPEVATSLRPGGLEARKGRCPNEESIMASANEDDPFLQVQQYVSVYARSRDPL